MLKKIKKIKFEFFRDQVICKYTADLADNGELESRNVVYLVPSVQQRSGGDKVLYRQSETINALGLAKIHAQVLHPHNLKFKHEWFDHNVNFKKDLKFNPRSDIVVIPEIWAVPHAKSLSMVGVDYAIFVQGGYIMNTPLYGWDISDINEAYRNAKLILSISDDTTNNIKYLFPDCAEKIIRIYYSVDSEKFHPHALKENLISYMPRRLERHAKLIQFFLKDKLPKHWKMQQIEGLNEDGVANLLNKSKIFLSFSELEGCPLPPVEAALAGNYVIGYTGQGAKEYWNPAIFKEIGNGEIVTFTQTILEQISKLENNQQLASDEFEISREQLKLKYSKQAEIDSLLNFIDRLRG